jgi:hypothetical protein
VGNATIARGQSGHGQNGQNQSGKGGYLFTINKYFNIYIIVGDFGCSVPILTNDKMTQMTNG